MGYISAEPRGPRHTCGNIGCLEVMASGKVIARRARERIAAGEFSSLAGSFRGSFATISARDVSVAGQAGDSLVVSVFREAGGYIGAELVSLMCLLNPTLIVLGGSVTLAGGLLLDPIRETVADRAAQAYVEQTRTAKAELGGDVGLWGALALALMSWRATSPRRVVTRCHDW